MREGGALRLFIERWCMARESAPRAVAEIEARRETVRFPLSVIWNIARSKAVAAAAIVFSWRRRRRFSLIQTGGTLRDALLPRRRSFVSHDLPPGGCGHRGSRRAARRTGACGSSLRRRRSRSDEQLAVNEIAQVKAALDCKRTPSKIGIASH